jgi:hypothetical protein
MQNGPWFHPGALEVVVEGDLAGDADLVSGDAAPEEAGQLLDVLQVHERQRAALAARSRRIGQERCDELLRGEAWGEGAGPDVGFQARGYRVQLVAVAQAVQELVPH